MGECSAVEGVNFHNSWWTCACGVWLTSKHTAAQAGWLTACQDKPIQGLPALCQPVPCSCSSATPTLTCPANMPHTLPHTHSKQDSRTCGTACVAAAVDLQCAPAAACGSVSSLQALLQPGGRLTSREGSSSGSQQATAQARLLLLGLQVVVCLHARCPSSGRG